MTTSLASYLVANGYCDLLLPGIKEPFMFSCNREEAIRVVSSRMQSWARCALDASASYINDAAALACLADAGRGYRVLVCLRNQFARAVSAFNYYRALLCLPNRPATATLPESHSLRAVPEALEKINSHPRLHGTYLQAMNNRYFEAFIIVISRYLAMRPRIITARILDCGWQTRRSKRRAIFWRRRLAPPAGAYAGTSILHAAIAELPAPRRSVIETDLEMERLASQSLPERVLYELRHLKRHHTFPHVSILINSFFAPGLERLFARSACQMRHFVISLAIPLPLTTIHFCPVVSKRAANPVQKTANRALRARMTERVEGR